MQKPKKTSLLKKENKGKPPVKRLLYVVILTALFYGIYIFACLNYFKPIIHIYAIVLGIILICYICLNRGLGVKLPSEDDLPKEWDKEKKQDYIDTLEERRNKYRFLIMIALPIIFTFMIDFIYITVCNIFGFVVAY